MSAEIPNYTKSPLYQDYKKYLAEFSVCIKPILEASYERNFVQEHGKLGFEIEKYCLAERSQVEDVRMKIKKEFFS